MKKKLIFFLLTVVCVLFCAPPALADNFELYVAPQNSTNYTKYTVAYKDGTTYEVAEVNLTQMAHFYLKNTTNNGKTHVRLSNNDWDISSKTESNAYSYMPSGSPSLQSDIYWNGQAGTYKFVFNYTNDNPYGLYFEKVQVQQTVAKPTFSPVAGTVLAGTKVTISCATTGATIYYTTNGTTPTSSSTKYTGPVAVNSAMTIKAIAVKSGMTNSAVASATYSVTFPLDFGGGKNPSKLTVIPHPNYDDIFEQFDLTLKGDIWTGTFTTKTPSKHGSYINFFIKDNNGNEWGTKGTGTETLGAWVMNAKGDKSDDYYYQKGLTDNKEYTFTLRANTSDKTNFDWKIDEVPGHTVKLDISKMQATKWNTNNVRAYFITNNGKTAGTAEWPGETGTANGDIITFNIYPTATPEYVVFNNGNSGSGNQTIDLPFVDNKTYILGNKNSEGKYVEVATTVPTTVNLPYGPSDFAEPKYFLVGSRMGAWHLQPEWELIKQADGSYKTRNGRFLYQSDFAVARVNNYNDYAYNRYELLANKGSKVTSKTTFTITDITKQRDCDASTSNPYISDMMKICFNGADVNDDNVRLDKGTYVAAITLKLADANKYTLKFDIDANANTTRRVFTLIGSDVKNASSLATTYKTRRASGSVNDGWQESWIQYDNAGKPYVDANGYYIYHTAFNSNWLGDHRVRFNIKDAQNRDFQYSSANVTFVHYESLDNLDTDPYREFYKHFTGQKEVKNGMIIQGGNAEDGTAYAFKANTGKDIAAANTDWQCYVVRDVWVKGEFKIWTGWGGNPKSSDVSDGSSDARWFVINGGPQEKKVNNEVVATVAPLSDINVGAANSQPMNLLYKDQGPGSNYKTHNGTNGGELTYYNRIVLWYNNKGGIENSFVMFIQEDAAPAIKAFLEGNDKNQPYYEWNLLNVNGNQEKVVGYTVTRYRVTEEGNTNPNEIETVTLDAQWKASDLGSVTEKTIYHEKKELNPGTYFYNIKVEFDNGDVREANSNRITVYGDDIAPDVRVEQLVILNKLGFEKLGVSSLFSDDQGTPVEYVRDKYYLTYRGNLPNADYYVIKIDFDGNNPSDIDIVQIKAEDAHTIINDPTLYVWAARFYVRALDYDAFKRHYEQIGVKTTMPEIAINDETALAENDATHTFGIENLPAQLVTVKTLNGDTKEYLGAFVGRKGLLRGGDMRATMSYTYGTTLTDGKYENKAEGLEHIVPFTPVIAQPYNLKTSYEYRTIPVNNALASTVNDEEKAEGYEAYYEISTYASNTDVASYAASPITVLAPESAITNERHLDMVIEFTRPNVSKRIYDLYDIYYTISVKANETEDVTAQDKLNYQVAEINDVYYDPNEQKPYEDNYLTPPPYHIVINNIHPAAAIYPSFEITKTEYRRSDEKKLEATHKYVDLFTSKPKVVSSATTIKELGLGVNPAQTEDNVGEGSRWFLYSHKELEHSETIGEDADIVNIDATKLFLLELTDGTNAAYGKNLWVHDESLATKDVTTGHFVQNKAHFIAAMPGNKQPDVIITPIYIFLHSPEFSSPQDLNTRYLVKEGTVPAKVVRRAGENADQATNTEFVINPNNIVNEKDADGKIIRTIYDATKDTQISVATGAVADVASANAPVMTGIEDVIGEGADGEAIYYNLQGIRVEQPVRGQVYIRCQAGRNETVVY